MYASTSSLLLGKALNDPCGQLCVDWALRMLEKGYNGANLSTLAGAVRPYSHFELAELRDKALEEVGIKSASLDEALQGYAAERLQEALNSDEKSLLAAVDELKDLCLKADRHRELYEFYLLHFAHEDVRADGYSYHVKEATPDNIITLIRAASERVIRKHETGKGSRPNIG